MGTTVMAQALAESLKQAMAAAAQLPGPTPPRSRADVLEYLGRESLKILSDRHF